MSHVLLKLLWHLIPSLLIKQTLRYNGSETDSKIFNAKASSQVLVLLVLVDGLGNSCEFLLCYSILLFRVLLCPY